MTRTRQVRDETGRVVVTRDDTAHVVRCAEAAWGRRAHAPSRFPAAVTALYRDFGLRVRAELRTALAHPAGTRVEDWDAVALRRFVMAAAGTGRVVSLDPLVEEGSALRLSRGFLPGGVRQVGLVARPGAPDLDAQLAALAEGPARAGCVLLDDDTYTGATLGAVHRMLADAGIPVLRAVCGIRVREARGPEPAFPLTSAVEYRIPPGARDLVQVADPRSFLFGVDGLVVRAADGGWLRVPYCGPFVSARARLGVPVEREAAFAEGVVAANLAFHTGLDRLVDGVLRVADLPFPVVGDPDERVVDVLGELATVRDGVPAR
ncbi:hypothetical protein ACTG9Q_14770 [Actinokineospora sp. 24-640]